MDDKETLMSKLLLILSALAVKCLGKGEFLLTKEDIARISAYDIQMDLNDEEHTMVYIVDHPTEVDPEEALLSKLDY